MATLTLWTSAALRSTPRKIDLLRIRSVRRETNRKRTHSNSIRLPTSERKIHTLRRYMLYLHRLLEAGDVVQLLDACVLQNPSQAGVLLSQRVHRFL